MEHALRPSNELAIKLPSFEGPLDLLLYLIRRSEIDIYDIPIEQVTHQYLEILNSLEANDLEVAGEFFVMAATLMYIKSRMLLPLRDQGADQDLEEHDADPRWELVQQLLEYKRFKIAAAEIEALISQRNKLFARIGPQAAAQAVPRPLKPIDRLDLWNRFNQVLGRLAERITPGEISAEQVTVAERMEFIVDRFQAGTRFWFSELLSPRTSITHLVATFLAVLELTRLGHILIAQNQSFSDIQCVRAAGPALS